MGDPARFANFLLPIVSFGHAENVTYSFWENECGGPLKIQPPRTSAKYLLPLDDLKLTRLVLLRSS